MIRPRTWGWAVIAAAAGTTYSIVSAVLGAWWNPHALAVVGGLAATLGCAVKIVHSLDDADAKRRRLSALRTHEVFDVTEEEHAIIESLRKEPSMLERRNGDR